MTVTWPAPGVTYDLDDLHRGDRPGTWHPDLHDTDPTGLPHLVQPAPVTDPALDGWPDPPNVPTGPWAPKVDVPRVNRLVDDLVAAAKQIPDLLAELHHAVVVARLARTDDTRARAELRAELDTARARLARNQHLGGAR